ncbi:hypothetical protein PV325_003493 [Microctonus aethiopoides]|nr:hypothetical protein PV325_003493 [Microctonus aethiopoides]
MFSVSQVTMRIVLEIFSILLFAFANASKCPETRKPHVTSCVIFYNCINLPEGGYVWAPSKCADGLVFQPSLRICVLPGDTWTCNDSIDQSSIYDYSLHSSESNDKIKTTHNDVITDDITYPIDFSHKIDGSSSNLGNVLMTIPYPLIEIDEKFNKNERHKINTDLLPISVKESGNDLSLVKHNQEFMPVAVIKVKDNENDKISNLKSFFNRIFLYQHIAPSLKQQTFISSPFIDHSIVTNDERISHNVLDRLIENYIIKKVSENLKTLNQTGIIINVKATTERIENNSEQSNFLFTTEQNQIDVETIDESSNILAIEGNLGYKEYVTIEKYKSQMNSVNIKIIEVISCLRGHRLPNSTDCTKYYTCDPTSAEIHEFICPPNTAFNNHINLCDTQKYKLCKANRNTFQSGKIKNTMKLQKIIIEDDFKDIDDNSKDLREH